MRHQQIAPAFASKLNSLIKEHPGKSQRRVAKDAEIDPAAVNRLCQTGVGPEDTVCKILEHMQLKRRRILEILADRRAELSEEKARKMWKGFRYAFLNAREYMGELCPFPLDTAYACSHAGMSIKRVVELARDAGIAHPEDVTTLTPWQVAELFDVLADEYGNDKAKILFSKKKLDRKVPPVLYVDTFQQLNAAHYVPLDKCTGTLLCGIPHVMVACFEFGAAGQIGEHFHAGGVEFLYSQTGTFDLIYRGAKYPRQLTNDGAVILLEANRPHSVKHVAGQPARLLVVRYDPQRRSLLPGPTLSEREDKKREKRRNANRGGHSQTP